MPSSASPSLRLEQQFTGENINVWGDLLNQVIAMLDAAIAGMTTIALTGNYTLVSTNFSADQARNSLLKFTGTLTDPVAVTIPSVSKIYVAWNTTNKIVNITTGAGTVVAIDPSDIVFLFSDGIGVKTLSYGGLDLKTYIGASVLAATGSLPAVTGNAGKFVYTDGVISFWKTANTTDLGDYLTKILGVQVALAVSL